MMFRPILTAGAAAIAAVVRRSREAERSVLPRDRFGFVFQFGQFGASAAGLAGYRRHPGLYRTVRN